MAVIIVWFRSDYRNCNIFIEILSRLAFWGSFGEITQTPDYWVGGPSFITSDDRESRGSRRSHEYITNGNPESGESDA